MLSVNCRNPIELVHSEIPQKFLSRWAFSLFGVYRETYAQTYATFAKPEAKNILPYFRRAKAEETLRLTAQLFPNAIISIAKNVARNWNYTQVRFGEVVLTESAVDAPNDLVRSALFRQTLSRANFQFNLYRPIEEQISGLLSQRNGFYYAILLHGQHQHDPERPGFAQLVFPSSTCNAYLTNIDLFDLCNIDPSTLILSTSEEKIPDDITPELRPDVIKRRDEV